MTQTTGQCARCGDTFTGRPEKVYCTERCRKKAERSRWDKQRYQITKALGPVHGPQKPRPARTRITACVGCGSVDGLGWWVGRMQHPGAAGSRCHACYLTYTRRRQNPQFDGVKQTTQGGMGRQCCIKCHRRMTGPRVVRCQDCFPVACSQCGEPTKIHNNIKTCSKCAKARLSTAMRRRRDAERQGDKGITWRKLGERDGWRCHLCNCKVLPKAGGAYEPMGANVDHLIPIADGGTHTWDNVALAHRRCNVSRGTQGEVQLRLVG